MAPPGAGTDRRPAAARLAGAADLARHRWDRSAPASRSHAVEHAVAWLHRAQDATGDDAIASFHLVTGWRRDTVPDVAVAVLGLLDHATTGSASSSERAFRLARSLLTADGSAQLGTVAPVVVRSLLRAGAESGDHRFDDRALELAERLDPGAALGAGAGQAAGDVAGALLDAWTRSGEARFRDAAARWEEAVLARQAANGWLPVGPDPGRSSRAGDLGSATAEALAVGVATGSTAATDAARRCAEGMARRFQIDRVLWSRYDDRWRGLAPEATTEDIGTVARAWSALSRWAHDPWYLNAALKLDDHLCARQLLRARALNVRGAAVGGSGWRSSSRPLELRSTATVALLRSLLAESLAVAPGAGPATPPRRAR